MRRISLIAIFLLINALCFGNAAPYTKAHITEVYFGPNFSKTIEIRFDIVNTFYDSAYCIYSSTDSAFLKTNPTEPGIYQITYLDLTSPFILHPTGDSLYIVAYSYFGPNSHMVITPTRFIFGNIENSCVNSPATGQSLVGIPDSIKYNDYPYSFPITVLDTAPSLGYERLPQTGTLQGVIYDSLGQAMPYQKIYLEGVAERVIWSDAGGFFMDTTLFGMNYELSIRDTEGNKTHTQYITINPGETENINITIQASALITVVGRINAYDTLVNPGAYAIFTPECPNAPIDTLLSDSTGRFMDSIPSGNYYIRFSKEGYVPWFTNHLMSLYDDINLGNRYLDEGSVCEIERGTVSGNWTNEHIYYVFGDIVLPENDSLYISQGVQVIICGEFSFRIEGHFQAIGSEDHIIQINSHPNIYHCNEFKIIGEKSSDSRIYHTRILDFYQMIIHDASPAFEKTLIDNYQNRQSIISGNAGPVFTNCGGNSPWAFGSYYCKDQSEPIFERNLLWSPGGTSFTLTDSACPVFSHNTFYHYWIGAWSHSEAAMPSFYGNIFCNGQNPVWTTGAGSVVLYNNSFYDLHYPLWEYMPGFGILDSINYNGDSCDRYGNLIDLDPHLTDPDNGNFYLLSESHCIDAGDPNSPFDPDSTIVDIGALYFDQIGTHVKEPETELLYSMKVIPNPNKGKFIIQIKSKKEHYYNARIDIYSVNGTLSDSRSIVLLEKGKNTYHFNNPKNYFTQNGLYICTLSIDNEVKSTSKMIILND